MRPGRCRVAAKRAVLRNPIRVLLVVAVMAVAGLGLAELPSAASGGSSPLVTPEVPAVVVPPTIFSFGASPPEIPTGSSTDFVVSASGSATLNYAYPDLPSGCVTSDTSFLPCTPTNPGTYNVTVVVSEVGTPVTAKSATTLFVDRVVTGTFFSLNTSVATWSAPSDQDCQSIASPPFYQNFCSPQAVQPSLLSLANGDVGIAYQLDTTDTANTCAHPGATVSRVAFQTSTNTGASFGSVTNLGNNSCSYLNAIEPSFAVGGSSVYGAFVADNSSLLPSLYVARGADALGFVRSTNDGTTFDKVVTLSAAGNIAHPEVAAVGSTVYIVYEDIANSSSPIGGGVLPISLHLLTSTNKGVTWRAAVTLPGLGASSGYTAASPAIAVNATGVVSVAYATNRVCLSTGPSGCVVYGDSIVVASSTDNGTQWSTPTVVGTGAGESACYTGACGVGYFQSTPEITFGYSPGGTDLYLVYAATYDQGASVADNYNHSGLFASVSTNSGVTWHSSAIDAPPGPSSVRYFEPALSVGHKEVYLSFLIANETAGQFGFANSLSDFVQTVSTGQRTWSIPTAADIESFTSGGSVNATRTSSPGFAASVTVLPSGRPLIAFGLPGAVTSSIAQSSTYYYVNTSYPTALVVGALVLPSDPYALTINFSQTGIPVGVNWELSVNGILYVIPTPSIWFTNVPANVPMMVGAYYAGGYWTIDTTYFNATLTSFPFNATVTFPFQVWVGFEFNTFPSGLDLSWTVDPYGEDYISVNVMTSPFYAYVYDAWDIQGEYVCIITCVPSVTFYNDYYSQVASSNSQCTGYVCNWTTPWYFPLGSTLNFSIYEWNEFGLTPTYLSGSGPGAYNGAMEANCPYWYIEPGEEFCEAEWAIYASPITMLGPVNETLWLADAPVNLTSDLSFSAYGLPSGSVYHFTLNGQAYAGNASQVVTVPSAPAGSYEVTSVWATAPTPGWEYFGYSNDPNPFLSPVLTAINLTFSALVNVSSPPGIVGFEAPALAAGVSWSITLNGTTYTSTTPWINVTTRPGTYGWSVGDAVSPSGTSGYVPSATSAEISVVPGNVYTVGYVPAYQVEALPSTGGYVSIDGGSPQLASTFWVAAGAPVRLSAITSSGYSFLGWSGTGLGAYSGTDVTTSVNPEGPIVESASFQPLPGARFNLTVTENGLLPGTWWTVNLGGAGYSTNASYLTVGSLWPWSAAGGVGQYTFSVPVVYLPGTNLTRFVPAPAPASVGTNGSFSPPLQLNFAPQSLFQLDALSGGVVEATYGGAPVGTSVWVTPGAADVSIVAIASPGYVFSNWEGSGPGSYSGTTALASVFPDGPVTEVAVFTVAVTAVTPRYALTFHVTTPVAPGTTWGIIFGGEGYSSGDGNLTIPGVLAGTYGISIGTGTAPNGLVQYRATPGDPVAYTVRGNATVDVAFQTFYWVNVAAAIGGSVTPGNGFYAAGSVLYLVATANATYSFTGWAGSGTGNYSGTNTTGSVLVSGPLSEVAGFANNGASPAASTIWSSPGTWFGLGAVALLAGLVLGLVGARWKAQSSAPPASPPRPAGGSTTDLRDQEGGGP